MTSPITLTNNQPLRPLAMLSARSNRHKAWWFACVTPLIVAAPWCFLLGEVGVIGTVSGLVLIVLLVTSAITDLNSSKIYNWATYSALLWAIGINLFASRLSNWQANYIDTPFVGPQWLGAVGIGPSLFAGVVCFFGMLFVYNLAGGGAGDVKLAAAIGALLGLDLGLCSIGYSYVLAGAWILTTSLWSIGPISVLAALARKVGSFLFPLLIFPPSDDQRVLLDKPIRLGPYFAAGTFLAILEATL